MGKVYSLRGRIGEAEVAQLQVGDVIYITGEIFTMRDQAHLKALEILRGGGRLPFDLEGGVIYHCGPLVKGGKVVSAGPTTSMRMERSEGEIIARTGAKCIIGKGGMGPGTLSALSKHSAVYTEYPGGAGALAARSVVGIRRVHWRELGDPEAVWALEVEDFGPCFVTMDSHGRTLRENLKKGAP
ncbi:MAG: fumarate hydratase C-terminal domain-containing protein [Candidatus Methanosuratus sp.]|nr:fumarate hydratase C-terminal domain-containing protein [Candidatus Methanosuratincola sp.]